MLGLLAGVLMVLTSRADIDEARLRRAPLPAGMHPLLTVVLDHSAATAQTLQARESYDQARDYGATVSPSLVCDPTKAYFRRGPGPAPDCRRQAGLDLAPQRSNLGLQCHAAIASLSRSGFYVASRSAQWRLSADGGYWGSLKDGSGEAVECRADRGRHGTTPGAWFASDGTGTPWTSNAAREIDWDRPPFADAYIFYAGNYLNYLRSSAMPVQRTVAELSVGDLAQSLDSTDELDVTLILVDDDGGDGGYVARAPASSHAVAADLRVLAASPPAGSALLAESLVEAARWLQGSLRQYGIDARADPAALGAGGSYRSPFEHACRPVSLAFLSAGVASDDEKASPGASALAHFDDETGGCGADCLPTLGSWLGSTDLREDLPGQQASPTSWIVPPTTSLRLNGEVASSADPLAYPNLVARAFQHDATVAGSPQLSAAALTAMHGTADDAGVFVGLSVPSTRARWPGNVFRYQLRAPTGPFEPPLVVDRRGDAAFDPVSGLPNTASQSLWSDAPDANLLTGGADGRLPLPGARPIHSDITNNRILDPANRLAPGNATIDRATVGLGTTDPESVDDALAWLVAQRALGDPGLDAPLVVEYPDAGRTIAFVATQDGVLHALDADSGVELWAWMPKALTSQIPDLMRDPESTVRRHGIDGRLVVHRFDPDADGRIESASGEHLWLLFGIGRSGNRYYALDIAVPLEPRLAWSLSLPDENAQSHAEPVVTRLAIAGSGQSAGNWIVLLSGGYDPRFDAGGATGSGEGAILHFIDAVSGRELWSAGAGAAATYSLTGIASIAAAPRALDLDGDGYLDRAYLLDVMGSLWRLDFSSGRPASGLAAGRRLARLGSGTRRFFATPDAALVRGGTAPRLAISTGSGWVQRPRDQTIEDRVYVIFDHPDSAAAREVADDDLYDATVNPGAMPPDAPGWYFRLAAHGAGEKVIGPAVTFDHALRFQTYEPMASEASAPCGPLRSVVRRYALDVRTALPREFAADSEEDDMEEVDAGGFPVDLQFGFPSLWEDPCPDCRPRPFGIAGGETFDPGYSGDPVRTSWRKLVPPPASP